MKNNLQNGSICYVSHIKPEQYVLLYPWMMVACDNSNDNDYDDGSTKKTRACMCV